MDVSHSRLPFNFLHSYHTSNCQYIFKTSLNECVASLHVISVCELSVARYIFVCYCRPCTCASSPYCYVLCEWQINICMVGNLRKEERAAVSVLCLGRREIRGAVIGCVERSHTDKSQQRKVLYRCLKTGSERWKIIWSFAFRVLYARHSRFTCFVDCSISKCSRLWLYNNARKYLYK